MNALKSNGHSAKVEHPDHIKHPTCRLFPFAPLSSRRGSTKNWNSLLIWSLSESGPDKGSKRHSRTFSNCSATFFSRLHYLHFMLCSYLLVCVGPLFTIFELCRPLFLLGPSTLPSLP